MADTRVWSRNFRTNNRNADWDPARNHEELRRERAAEREAFAQEQSGLRQHLRHGNRLHAEVRENRGDRQRHGIPG